MATIEDKKSFTTLTDSFSSTGTQNNTSSSSDFRIFSELFGGALINEYKTHADTKKDFNSSTEKARFFELAARAGVLHDWRSFINHPRVTNLSTFANTLNDFIGSQVQDENLHEKAFQEIINKMSEFYGDHKIAVPYSKEKISIAEVLSSGAVDLYINTPDFKAVMNATVDHLLDARSPQMQEMQSLSQDIEPEALTKINLTGTWAKTGVSLVGARLGFAGLKRYGVDIFTGKARLTNEFYNASEFSSNRMDKYLKKNNTQWTSSSEVQKNTLRKTHLDKILTDDKLAETIVKSAKVKSSGVTSALSHVTPGLKDKTDDIGLKVLRAKAKNLKLLTNSSKATSLVSSLRNFKPAFSLLSKLSRVAGVAGGPLGIAIAIGGGFLLDMVVGEAIDAASVISNGGKVPNENKGPWYTQLGETLGGVGHSWFNWVRGV